MRNVVLLAAPPHCHPDHFEASVAAGKEIFSEKPVATDATGVRRVQAACKTAVRVAPIRMMASLIMKLGMTVHTNARIIPWTYTIGLA